MGNDLMAGRSLRQRCYNTGARFSKLRKIFVRFFLSSSSDFHKSFVSQRDTTS